jgi:hypothetical protein
MPPSGSAAHPASNGRRHACPVHLPETGGRLAVSISMPLRHHSGSNRGREPSRLTALEDAAAADADTLRCQPISNRRSGPPEFSIRTPPETRTRNLRILSAAPLPDWASGAMLASRHWRSNPTSSTLRGADLAGSRRRAGSPPRRRTAIAGSKARALTVGRAGIKMVDGLVFDPEALEPEPRALGRCPTRR